MIIKMKTGRPVKNIDLSELKELMKFYPSLEEMAGWFDVSPDTISRKIKEEFQLSFREFRNRYTARTKIALKRQAIEMALDGNERMLVHSLRTLTDMDDRPKAQDLSSSKRDELVDEARELIASFD